MTVRHCGLCLPLVAAVLQACSSAGPGQGYYAVPLSGGEQLDVRTRLSVEPGNSRVYLQYGRTLPYLELNQYEPFCYFRMDGALPVIQHIDKGLYIVTGISSNETEVVQLPVMTAASVELADGGYGPITYLLAIRLRAASGASAVRELVCMGGFASPYDAEPVSMAAIQSSLGELAVFSLKP